MVEEGWDATWDRSINRGALEGPPRGPKLPTYAPGGRTVIPKGSVVSVTGVVKVAPATTALVKV